MDSNLSGAILNVPIVGVALGLMFTYLIVSLVASVFKEWVASIFQWRGTYLQQGISVLLSNVPNTGFAWGGLWNWVVAHLSWADPTGKAAPVLTAAAGAAAAGTKAVNAAKQVVAAAATAAAAPGATQAPIDAAIANDRAAAAVAATQASAAANLAIGAFGAVAPGAMATEAATIVRSAIAATNQAAAAVAAGMAAPITAATAAPIATAEAALTSAAAALAVQRVQTHPLLKGTPAKLPSYVPARDFATALLELLRDGSANPAFSQVERTVAALPDGDMKRVLSAFIQDAAGDLDKLRARIETWFDDSMDRLSGIYKRFAQYFLLGLGVLIAVTMNVDSVHMAVALWQQPTLRGALVAELQQDMKTGSGAATTGVAKTTDINPADHRTVQQAVQQVQDASLPIGRAPCATWFGQQATPAEAAAAKVAALKAQSDARKTAASAAPADAATAAASTAPSAAPACPAIPVDAAYVHWAAWTILGWLITGFAISLGAPFWFGLLQNVMNLRAAGTPPARSDAAPAAASGAASGTA